MPFALPALPFGRDALAPFMSGETLDYRHGRHRRACVDWDFVATSRDGKGVARANQA